MERDTLTIRRSNFTPVSGDSSKTAFKKVLGYLAIPNIYTNLRLHKAASLLKTTNFSLDQICYIVSFKNAEELTESFIKKYCMTPKEYRQKFQQN